MRAQHLVDDLCLDSISLMGLVYKIEERFKFTIPFDMDLMPETIGEVVTLILKNESSLNLEKHHA